MAPEAGQVIGWREWVAMPALLHAPVRAKVDTGARTSALHAVDLEFHTVDGVDQVHFSLPFESGRRVSHPVHGRRKVRNTGGVPELRTTIRTDLVLGDARWLVEVTLADRTGMLNPLILGRTAIRRRKLLVNAGRSFLCGAPHATGDDT
ncbi:MAG: RimK/LysX family protein [Pseudomonadota bacterium]